MASLGGNIVTFDSGLSIAFQRTLRLPEDGRAYHLQAGLGPFHLRDVSKLPGATRAMRQKGGVVMPMYSNEALRMRLVTPDGRPVLLKPYAGGVNAVTGDPVRRPDLAIDPANQDYVVVGSNMGINPDGTVNMGRAQSWLDGFRQAGGTTVRQFVATANAEFSVEGQLGGQVKMGGMQFVAIPMSDKFYNEVYKPAYDKAMAERPRPMEKAMGMARDIGALGLEAGAPIIQKVYKDQITPSRNPDEVWDIGKADSFRVQIVPAASWSQLTGGEKMPHPPITEAQYAQCAPTSYARKGAAGVRAASHHP